MGSCLTYSHITSHTREHDCIAQGNPQTLRQEICHVLASQFDRSFDVRIIDDNFPAIRSLDHGISQVQSLFQPNPQTNGTGYFNTVQTNFAVTHGRVQVTQIDEAQWHLGFDIQGTPRRYILVVHVSTVIPRSQGCGALPRGDSNSPDHRPHREDDPLVEVNSIITYSDNLRLWRLNLAGQKSVTLEERDMAMWRHSDLQNIEADDVSRLNRPDANRTGHRVDIIQTCGTEIGLRANPPRFVIQGIDPDFRSGRDHYDGFDIRVQTEMGSIRRQSAPFGPPLL